MSKVIGTLTTLPLWGERTTHEVIDIIENENGRIYVLNEWYKPNVRQLIHQDMVEKYKEIS
jgi:hypothetical protein